MKQNDFKVLFAGGGTGGHLYSGVAIADLMKRDYPKARVLFVGTPFGLEKKIVPECGYPLELINASPLKGSGLIMRLKSLSRLPKAYCQSKKILKRFQPDIVIGIGGYASGPMALAAHFQKIFTGIIEQNSYPGFTNRQLGRFVDKIFITFEKARTFFPASKTLLTGNPVRRFAQETKTETKELFTIFILGGSQGAHTINQGIIHSLPLLREIKSQLHFIHQSGKNDFEEIQHAYQNSGISAQVFAFDNELGKHYAQADLAICRAGAGTITELRLQGLPSVLIPYPYATDDHQYYNAKEMVDAKAAELCKNSAFTGQFAAERIQYYLQNRQSLTAMGAAALQQAKPNAAQEVLAHCLLSLD